MRFRAKLCGKFTICHGSSGSVSIYNAVSKPCFSCRVLRYCEHISVKSYNRYVFAVSYVVMTLNYYAHATYESARDEFDRIMGATRITDLPKQEAERISA